MAARVTPWRRALVLLAVDAGELLPAPRLLPTSRFPAAGTALTGGRICCCGGEFSFLDGKRIQLRQVGVVACGAVTLRMRASTGTGAAAAGRDLSLRNWDSREEGSAESSARWAVSLRTNAAFCTCP
jgi:hypothetical protein